MTEKKDVAVIDWDAEFKKSTEMMLEQEKPDNKFISFKSGVMSLNDQPAEGNAIECVIVASAFENAYFPDRYDPNKIVSPACWAVAFNEDDLAPDAELVTEAQEVDCASCAMNEWGSDPNGGKGKACKNVRRIALIQAHQVESVGAGVDTLFAKLPVTSVANWSKYVVQLGNVVRRPPWAVVTKMSVVPDAKTQFKVNFEFVRMLEEPALEPIHRTMEGLIKNEGLLFSYPKNDDEEEEAPKPRAKPKPGAKSKF